MEYLQYTIVMWEKLMQALVLNQHYGIHVYTYNYYMYGCNLGHLYSFSDRYGFMHNNIQDIL